MSRGWNYRAGDWNAVCDSCGGKFKASQMKRRWDGFMVCKDDFEMRHPQDFLKARSDKISVPWSRPQLPVVFSDVTGWTDFVSVKDGGTVIIVQHVLDIAAGENVPVTESMIIGRLIPAYDVVSVTELFETLVFTEKDLFDVVSVTEGGHIFFSDYVDFSYFLEEYVGTVTPIP